MNAEALKAGRLAVLRGGLRSARSPSDPLPALAEMIRIAKWLLKSGDNGPVGARTVLSHALAYLRAVSEWLAPGDDHRPVALFLEAEASRLRAAAVGPVTDLDNSIVCLRRLRAMLAADDPDLVMVEVELGLALFIRVGRPGPRLADLDEASALLTSVLDRTETDDPGRREITSLLASQRAVRYSALGGTDADRETAITHAATCLEGTATPDEISDNAHIVAAWMALTRQLTPAQRSTMYREREIEAARAGGDAAVSLFADLGLAEVSGADAETAIGHLRQVRTTPEIDAMCGLIPVLWSTAIAARMRADGTVEDVERVVSDLDRTISLIPEEDPERGELLTMRAMLLAMQPAARPEDSGPQGWDRANDAMGDALARLPPSHPIRSAGLDLLTYGLGRQVAESESDAPDDTAARLDAVVTMLERMPRDDPGFARAMTTVAMQVMSVGARRRFTWEQDRLVVRLQEAVVRLAPDDPLRPLAENMHWSAVFMKGIMEQRPDVVDDAIGELIRCAEPVPAGYPYRPWLLASIATALIDRHGMGGEVRDLERAGVYLDRAFAAIDPAGPFAVGTELYGALRYLRGHLQLIWSLYDPSPERMTEALSNLEGASELVDRDRAMYPGLAATIKVAQAAQEFAGISPDRGMYLGDGARLAFQQILDLAESAPRDSPEFPVLASQAVGGLVLRGLADNDPVLIDRAVALIAEACSVDGLAVRERPRVLTLHGEALCTRYMRSRDPRDLANAIDRLEEARRAVEQEIGSPYAANVLETLANAYRLRGDVARGDVDRAITMGLAGLREHAGDVLLQDSDENALHVARRGTSGATETARWSLSHGRGAAAIDALELGRGMVLHAATSGAGLEEALREAGRSDLAEEWAREIIPSGATEQATEGTTETDHLRYRVMLALERSSAEARLLAPPSLADIATALAESGADALAYLLPRDDSGFGMAVVVEASGAVRLLRLPGLYAGERSPVGKFRQTRRALDAAERGGDAETAARSAWLKELDSLCGWAWRAAVGPLLDTMPAHRGRKELRLVLVPGGELGLVPWHAARRGERYACQEAVFCYAASARQFVDATRRNPRPWVQAPVLVSDADGSYLPAVGIAHLHMEHYAYASVFGSARYRLTLSDSVPGSLAAAPEDVLAALPHNGDPGASLIHFGCHGYSAVPVLGSSVKLGGGHEVAVRDILRQARVWQPEHPDSGGLVVLAACLTDVSEADYDEALTLATAFLTAGANGVVAARWAVPEDETAILMAVFHHYLNTGYPSPASALRAAQLWMLDPGRAVPDHLPGVLRDEVAMTGKPGGPDLASPAAWAGFAYQGR